MRNSSLASEGLLTLRFLAALALALLAVALGSSTAAADDAPGLGPAPISTYNAQLDESAGADLRSARLDEAATRDSTTYDPAVQLGDRDELFFEAGGSTAAPTGDAHLVDRATSWRQRSQVAANSGSRIAANQAAGNAARDALAGAHPGALIEQSFSTTAGVRRLDILTRALGDRVEGRSYIAHGHYSVSDRQGRTAAQERRRYRRRVGVLA